MMYKIEDKLPVDHQKIIAITKTRGVVVGNYYPYKNPTVDTGKGAYHFTHWISELEFIKNNS